MILLPLQPSQAEHGEGGGTTRNGVDVNFWTIGSLDGEVVSITEDGQGWLGQYPARQPYVPMNRQLLPFHDVPPLPADGDGPGWDAWAATIRERIAAAAAPGRQQSIFE